MLWLEMIDQVKRSPKYRIKGQHHSDLDQQNHQKYKEGNDQKQIDGPGLLDERVNCSPDEEMSHTNSTGQEEGQQQRQNGKSSAQSKFFNGWLEDSRA